MKHQHHRNLSQFCYCNHGDVEYEILTDYSIGQYYYPPTVSDEERGHLVKKIPWPKEPCSVKMPDGTKTYINQFEESHWMPDVPDYDYANEFRVQ